MYVAYILISLTLDGKKEEIWGGEHIQRYIRPSTSKQVSLNSSKCSQLSTNLAYLIHFILLFTYLLSRQDDDRKRSNNELCLLRYRDERQGIYIFISNRSLSISISISI